MGTCRSHHDRIWDLNGEDRRREKVEVEETCRLCVTLTLCFHACSQVDRSSEVARRIEWYEWTETQCLLNRMSSTMIRGEATETGSKMMSRFVAVSHQCCQKSSVWTRFLHLVRPDEAFIPSRSIRWRKFDLDWHNLTIFIGCLALLRLIYLIRRTLLSN